MKAISPFHCLLICFYFLLPVEVQGEDWKFIANDEEGLWVYNAESMECFSKHRIKVQTRKIYERKAVLAAVEKYGKSYENLDHVRAEWEIDCFQRKFKLCSATFHSKENDVIERYEGKKEGGLTPEDIPCDSYLELLRRKVCR